MSVTYQDYYQTLGVERTATKEDISRAYKKLARKYHPDLNKDADAEDKFKKLNEANEVLSDPVKRQQYDALGANWRAGQQFQPPPGWDQFGNRMYTSGGRGGQSFHFGNGQESGGFSDFFDMLFGGTNAFFDSANLNERFGKASSSSEGKSIEAEFALTLEEAVKGGKKKIVFELITTKANGTQATEQRKYDVSVPTGVKDGMVIRLSGQGAKGARGGKDGDLLLKVKLLPHPKYKVQQSDLLTVLPLSPWEAALGAKLKMQTLHDAIQLAVPAGAQSGQVLRVRGKGLPIKKDEFGDLLVELKVNTPKTLTEEERVLFEKLAKISTYNPRAQ